MNSTSTFRKPLWWWWNNQSPPAKKLLLNNATALLTPISNHLSSPTNSSNRLKLHFTQLTLTQIILVVVFITITILLTLFCVISKNHCRGTQSKSMEEVGVQYNRPCDELQTNQMHDIKAIERPQLVIYNLNSNTSLTLVSPSATPIPSRNTKSRFQEHFLMDIP
jgi:hypothetical protein